MTDRTTDTTAQEAGGWPAYPGRRCGNCLYWQPHMLGGTPLDRGECRRKPPVLKDGDFYPSWPGLDADDWCGEWARTTLRPPAESDSDPPF